MTTRLQATDPVAPRRLFRLDPVQQRRLARWAQVVERNPNRWLRAFSYKPGLLVEEHGELALAGSALELAYADELLRRDGLANSSIGAATHFFGLDTGDVQEILFSGRDTGLNCAGEVASAIRRSARWASPARRFILNQFALIIAGISVAVFWVFVGFQAAALVIGKV